MSLNKLTFKQQIAPQQFIVEYEASSIGTIYREFDEWWFNSEEELSLDQLETIVKFMKDLK